MKQSLHPISNKQRLAIVHFFVLSILFFANYSVSAQGNFQLEVVTGKQTGSSISISNECEEKQLYRLAGTKNIRLTGDSIFINGHSTVSIAFVFDAAGLAPGVYSESVRVERKGRPNPANTFGGVKCYAMRCKPPLVCDNGFCITVSSCKSKSEIFTIEITVKPAPTPTPTPTTPTPTPTPTPTSTSTPTTAPGVTETPAPTETPLPPVEISLNTPSDPGNNLIYAAMFFTVAVVCLLAFISISSVFAKKLFNKWKYGGNAAHLRTLKRAVKAKEKLSKDWMRKRRTKNIHAIGVGKIDGTDNYCIQVFVEDANGQMLENPPVQLLPERSRNFPIFIFEMPRAEFLNGNYGKEKEPHKTIIGGISGANTNLSNEYGTIGYFCSPTILRPVRKFRKDVFLLSNAHVFANLSKPEKTVSDLIQQPSPGENKRHDFIASLENYVPIKFDNDTDNPNYTDAAIAKLFPKVAYKPEIPVIGKIVDHVPKEKVELRQKCRKFGRTTGYTEGNIFSIHLSIWIRYGSTSRECFFKDQFLIVADERHDDFVRGGDSGSLVADEKNNAIGLIFAGGSSANFALEDLPTDIDVQSLLQTKAGKVRNYGVANPISDVLKDLNVKLTL